MATRSGAEAPAVLLAACAGAVDVSEDLPRLDQEDDAGGGQRNVVGAALEEADAELAFEPLHLLAQRRLDDVLPFGRPPEVQIPPPASQNSEAAVAPCPRPSPHSVCSSGTTPQLAAGVPGSSIPQA